MGKRFPILTMSDTSYASLNPITLDITDFLYPEPCGDFEPIWSLLEWENKVEIKVIGDSFSSIISRIQERTNMYCIFPRTRLSDYEACSILSANFCAKSKFDEHVLANVSLEKKESMICGHVRVRSKSNSLAQVLGSYFLSM